MSEKYKNTCKYFSYVGHLLILVSTVTGCVSISIFALLVWASVCIASSAVSKKIYAIIAGIKKYKWVIKKKKKKNDELIRLGKDKLNFIEILISKAWIDSYIHILVVTNLFQ